MAIAQRFLVSALCIVMFSFAAMAQNVSTEDVARVASQYNQMSDQEKAALLNIAKQKYDSMSEQERKRIVAQIKSASSGTPYESQVLQMEKKLRGNDIPESMKDSAELSQSNAVVSNQQPVEQPIYQKPALQQAEAFMQANEGRLSDNQKKGMEHWKEQLEAQERMHQQYIEYMQKQGQQQ